MFKFALCDDEQFWIEKIIAYFEMCEYINVSLCSYNSGQRLLEDCQNEDIQFDAIFLDMEMPGMNGLEIAKALRDMGNRAIIVFVTAYDQYAVEGYEYEAFGYLLKPKLEEKLPHLVTALVRKLNSQCASIVIKTTQGEIAMSIQEILFCEKNGHYIVIHTENAVYKTRTSMSDFKKQISSEWFVRCHNGFMVNLPKVRNLTEKNVIMQRIGVEVPIGRAFKATLRKTWAQYLKMEAGL